ncbi:unnamed protein product, partial [Ectocarpus sp. 12 AP-2014]
MSSTPGKDSGAPRKRAHPTPSWSHRSFESSRGASRQRVETPLDIALEEFNFLSWDDPTQLKTWLPLCLYLK